MRFLFITFLFILFDAKSQSSEIISWDAHWSLENKSADSSEIKGFHLMFPMILAKNTFYIHGDTMVTINKFDSLNQIRNVMIKDKNHFYIFATVDGVTYFKKEYYTDIKSELLQIEETKLPFTNIGNKMIGPFNCSVKELSLADKNLKFTLTGTKDINFQNDLLKLPIEELQDIGFILDYELDYGYVKMIMHATNFNHLPFDTSVFSMSHDGLNEMDWTVEMRFMQLILGPDVGSMVSKEDNNPVGEGKNYDIYLKMCQDEVLYMCDENDFEQKPSYDKPILISYLKTNADHSDHTKKEFDHLFLKYNLITLNDLSAFNKILNKIEKNTDVRAYRDLIQFLSSKKMLDTKEFREILIKNLAKNNFNPKNKNHPEASDFINKKIDWKTFLCSYQGIYDLQIKKIVHSEIDFLNEIKGIISQILPEVYVKVNEQKNEIELIKNKIAITYPVDTKYEIDAKYDDGENIIKSGKPQYDFENYSKHGLLKMLRQIGADFDLEMVFDFINTNSVLPHQQDEELYEKINLFNGNLFLCIDKNSSEASFEKKIPFTKTDYDERRDKLASIKGFYASNPGITYVPLYKKEKFLQLIHHDRSTFGLDASFDENLWFTNVKHQLYDNLGAMTQSIPNFGIIVNGTGYNNKGNSYETIFPNLKRLFGIDFQPKDLILKIEESNVELSFKYLDNSYTIDSYVNSLEADFLKKAIELLKENDLYESKMVYQSIENYSDFNTNRLFYISRDTYKILTKELELSLIEYE
jgi:hypothetical protein